VFQRPDSRWFRQEYLARTQAFYDKYGGITIIIGRFIPIIRTFAPFLAGVAGMSYRRFLSYNIVGGCLWIGLLVYAGYLFGNIPWVKDNLSMIVVAIVAVSLIPAVTTFVKERRYARRGMAVHAAADASPEGADGNASTASVDVAARAEPASTSDASRPNGIR
jgi:membrane-associated protein